MRTVAVLTMLVMPALVLAAMDDAAWQEVLRRRAETGWGMTPLGEKGTLNLPRKFTVEPKFAGKGPDWKRVPFCDESGDGVIVADADDAEAVRLAGELRWHFEEMSGKKIAVVSALPPNVQAVVLRRGGKFGETHICREGKALILEGAGRGLSHAVTYLLEAMGCRYLWPGKLGKVIPHVDTLCLPDIDVDFIPRFKSRNIRTPSYDVAGKELESKFGFSQDEVRRYDRLRSDAEIDRRGNRDYYSWHGVAKEDDCTEHRQWGHTFGDYYQKYGESHPEYFALQPDGTRRLNLGKHPSRPAFCLSSRTLIRQMADDVIAAFKADPELSVKSICLPDGGNPLECMCEECRKLDPPDGANIRLWVRERTNGFKNYVSLTDRTLSYANRVAELVAAECPGKRLSLYAYAHYTDPPLSVKPHPSLVILSVVGNYESLKGRSDVERNLAAWTSFGNEVLWRPNTLIGFRMAAPQCVGHVIFSDLEKVKANGVTGADVCASSSQWACRAFDVYCAAKSLLNPDRRDYEAVAEDFCRAGFGSAAEAIRCYFDALAEMGDRAAAEPEEVFTTTTGPSIMRGYVKVFDPDRLDALLDKAVSAASDDETVLKRIDFLRIGVAAGRLDRALGLARMKGKKFHSEQRALVDFLRRTMFEHPLAVAPYWCASNFYEPHLRGYSPVKATAGMRLQPAPAKIMGRDFWSLFETHAIADPGQPMQGVWNAPELAELPMFKDSALIYKTGAQYYPPTDYRATWPTVRESFSPKAKCPLWEAMEKNSRPENPVFINFPSKRKIDALAGPIELDRADYEAWKARHPNLVGAIVLSEWGADIAAMRNNLPKITNEVKRAEVAAYMEDIDWSNRYDRVRLAKRVADRRRKLYYGDDSLFAAMRSFYYIDHMAAAWGAKMILSETSDTTGGNAEYRWDVSAMFARGAARQFGIPWLWYTAIFRNAHNREGKFLTNCCCFNMHCRGNCQPGGGVSPSLQNRAWYYAYLNGASGVEQENWWLNFMQLDSSGKKVELADRGRNYAAFHDFTRRNPNRGSTYAPVAILVPFAQGYRACGGNPWSVCRYLPGDQAVDAVFFTVIPGFERLAATKAGKEANLHNSPYAMMYDVLVPNSPQSEDDFRKVLSNYSAAILVGEYQEPRKFERVLSDYEREGGRLFRVTPEMLPPVTKDTVEEIFSGKRRFPAVERIVKQLQDEFFPAVVEGDVQYGASKTERGWWIWCLNNRGITKFPDEHQQVDESAVAKVSVRMKKAVPRKVQELVSGRVPTIDKGVFSFVVSAGGVAVFEVED